MIDLEQLIAAARHRLHKSIDLRCALAQAAQPASTIRRSIGQQYKLGTMPTSKEKK